jgi:hypothetical protein
LFVAQIAADLATSWKREPESANGYDKEDCTNQKLHSDHPDLLFCSSATTQATQITAENQRVAGASADGGRRGASRSAEVVLQSRTNKKIS